jgi:riboflavin synthase
MRSIEGGAREVSVALPKGWSPGTKAGDSIAVHGICLTAARISSNEAVFQAVRETVNRTTLGNWNTGTKVNLERSLPADGRFGGHIVTGHVDAATAVRSVENTGTGREIMFALPVELTPLVAEKGSIAIDGISLTVARVADDIFSVAIIPETLARTTIGSLKPGDRVNLEADVIARYVKKAVETMGLPKGRIDVDFLKKHGFA